MSTFSIQVQSVVYKNEKANLFGAIAAMSNAVRVYNKIDGGNCTLDFVYGDGSPELVMQPEDVAEIQKKYGEYVNFRYQPFGENTGSAKGHNILAKDVKTDYIMIMNPDVKVSPHFLREAMKPFADEKVGMVEARQTPLEHQKEYDIKTLETEWATTACAIIRRDIFEQLEGFDYKTFFLYCDDLDFSWRLRLAGYKIIYQPLAPVYHAKTLNIDGSWMPTNAERYYSAEAAILMAYKWSNPERVEKLLQQFDAESDITRKAAAEFRRRQQEGTLPQPIDPEHKIARFIGDFYSENRFVL